MRTKFLNTPSKYVTASFNQVLNAPSYLQNKNKQTYSKTRKLAVKTTLTFALYLDHR